MNVSQHIIVQYIYWDLLFIIFIHYNSQYHTNRGDVSLYNFSELLVQLFVHEDQQMYMYSDNSPPIVVYANFHFLPF